MFWLTKQILKMLLTNIESASNYTTCVSLGFQKCMIQATLINLHLNKYSQELHYYPCD